MLRALPVLLLVVAAGCAGPGPEAPQDEPPALLSTHDVVGRVTTPAFNPIDGVRVWIGQSSLCTTDGTCTADWGIHETTTGSDGMFAIPGIWAGHAQVHLEHADFEALNVTVEVPSDPTNLTMAPIDRVVPYVEPWREQGYIECGADHLIFSGSCDEFAGEYATPVQGTFADQREFQVDVGDGWATLVIDLSFSDIPPSLAGLRLAAYSNEENAATLSYERYHQAWDAQAFTLRLEPGTDYGDQLATPSGATTFRLEVFPLGHAYREVCGGDTCFTGVGASGQIDFEIIAHTFYHEEAPEGWTVRTD